jgi:dihydropteroate synthase
MNNTININGDLLDLSTPIVMGILNITPDSFYAGSRKQEISDILNRVQEILSQGGTIIDIGAQSTRPTSELLSAQEEISRLVPALTAINNEFPEAIISVDTFYSEVAEYCVNKHRISIINDISGGEIDKKMFETVAHLQVPYILMHMRGTPQTMQQLTNYNHLIQDISFYFSEKIAKLHHLGVNDIIIDPGFGFSKDVDQNYELMRHLSFFENFDLPLLVGVSRKSMACKLLDIKAKDALNATTILNTYALMNGANILRVHDVKEAMETIKITEQLKKYLVSQ